ncbi:MAG: hypoxanthine phosphoribosyltransferase [Magnetococcales bacterium]|nr:hypoxanthine phosphoribosyltransferase [Magnetococcales bacterium]
MTTPPPLTPDNAQVKTLLEASAIQARIETLAGEIFPRLQEQVVVVALLKGAYVFTADLVRALSKQGAKMSIQFMVLSSYGAGTVSSGRVQVKLDCDEDLTGRQVLLLDDILDSGNTLSFAVDHLKQKGATEVLTAVLLDKPARRTTPAQADFVGFAIDNLFVVGYGIDFAEHFRDRADVGFIQP